MDRTMQRAQTKPATTTKPARKSRVKKAADRTLLDPGYVAELQADLTKDLDLQPISQPASETSTAAYVASLHAAPEPTPELLVNSPEAPAPTASDTFQAKVAALLELVRQGPDAVAEALRSGKVSVKLPREPRQPRQPAALRDKSTLRGPHKGLDDATKQRVIDLRNQGKSYVDIDKALGYEDAEKTRGRVSYLICRDARAAGVKVR